MPDRPDPLAALLRRGWPVMVRRGLRGVWLRGGPPPGPFVWAANHHSWWDPFLAAVVLDRLGRAPCLLMRQDSLERYGFVRRAGAFGTAEPRRGLAHLRAGRALVVFPEGELRPAGPPGQLADGAAWYARWAEVPLCAVAVRVALRGHAAPEAYAACVPVETAGPLPAVTGRLARALATQLAELDRLVATTDPRLPLPGFGPLVAGRRSAEERIDAAGRQLDRLGRRRPWR